MAITSQAVQAKRDLRIGDKIFTFLKYFLLILFSIIALIPVSVCVLTAFKTTDEYNTTNVLTPPQNWLNFDNFVTAFERANMLRGFLNTGIALVFVLLFSILNSLRMYSRGSCSGYWPQYPLFTDKTGSILCPQNE